MSSFLPNQIRQLMTETKWKPIPTKSNTHCKNYMKEAIEHCISDKALLFIPEVQGKCNNVV